jgi:hypothetical protein
MDNTERTRLAGQIRVMRFLVTSADNRSKTHGDKHHYHKVLLAMLSDMEGAVTGISSYHDEVQVYELYTVNDTDLKDFANAPF